MRDQGIYRHDTFSWQPLSREPSSDVKREVASLVRVAENSPRELFQKVKQSTYNSPSQVREFCRALGVVHVKGNPFKILIRRIDRIAKNKSRPEGRKLYDKIMTWA